MHTKIPPAQNAVLHYHLLNFYTVTAVEVKLILTSRQEKHAIIMENCDMLATSANQNHNS